MKDPVRVAVTGAAGQIGYALVFRTAGGQMLGDDQPMVLQLLEIPQAVGALDGVRMELDDCAFPLLAGVVGNDDAERAFEGANYALLVGAMPRKEGMQRADLLSANGAIFTAQGKAISENAADDVRVLVVGNPAKAQLARKAGAQVADVSRMTIWGNHSATQYPDVFHAEIAGKPAFDAIGSDRGWLEHEFIPTVQQRGAAVIKARGLSSAASAANAAIEHVRDWARGTPSGDWVSMAVPSDGTYGVPEGLIC